MKRKAGGRLAGVSDVAWRAAIAVGVAVVLALGLMRVRRLPRDVALSVYALAVALLGLYAVLGVQAAIVGGGIIGTFFAAGALIYGLLTLASRWAERHS